MKHHLLRFVALLLLAVPVLQAQMQEKKIIVSSLGTPEKAERALEQLQNYLEKHPEIISILDENGIALHSRPSGKYFIVVIEPFADRDNLTTVKKVVQKRYPRLFVNNYTPETDMIVSESTTPSKVTIQEEVTLDMVVEKVPESLVVIKDSEDSVPRVVIADKVEVPKVIAIDKKTLEANVEKTPEVISTAKDNISKVPEVVTTVEKVIEKNISTPPKVVVPIKENIEKQIQEVNESNLSQAVTIIKEKVIEEHTQKAPVAHKKAVEHAASTTETTTASADKEKFISHNPDHKAQAHDSIFPPWWVLLSVLVLILSPIGSYIENRNNRLYR